MRKRFLSLILALVLCLALFPAQAFAGPVSGNNNGGGAGGPTSPRPTGNAYEFISPGRGVGAGKVTATAFSWGERAKLCKDAATLYKVLAENSALPGQDVPEVPGSASGVESTGFLTQHETWALPAEDPADVHYDIDLVQIYEDNEFEYLAGGSGSGEYNFSQSDFYTVDPLNGDTAIDFGSLKQGDMVRNTSFNGLYITKVVKSGNPQYDSDMDNLKSNMIASFRAYELDHPEVFWLTGSVKLRFLTVTLKGKQETYLFLTLADSSGFSMRIPDYAESGAIEAAIQQREKAVETILKQIPEGATDRQIVANLNKWFTLNNEYNRSADLNAIGYKPHRSLSALVGNEGVNGPVCDGYSRAFKVICDRLGIPVILDTGYASIGSQSEYHMWIRVRIDGEWYGLDCTWNDPIIAGRSGKVSGFENERYLLVGSDTVVDGQKFGVSHPSDTTACGTTGVLFASLLINVTPDEEYIILPFRDVRLTDWFYEHVKAAYKANVVGGMTDTTYVPNLPKGSLTHAQIMVMVANLHSQQKNDGFKAVPIDGEHWGAPYRNYCQKEGIIDDRFDSVLDVPVTREEMCYYFANALRASSYKEKMDAAFSDIADSPYAAEIEKLAKADIVSGYPGGIFKPGDPVSRAEAAVFIKNILALID